MVRCKKILLPTTNNQLPFDDISGIG